MRIISPTEKQNVYHKWLKSELYRVRNELSPEDITLIESPNLADEEENEKRRVLLFDKYGRSAILQTIPNDIVWHEVVIEDNDIDSLYILPVFDWFMDTGRTFKISDTINHLAPNRGYNLSSTLNGQVVHHQKVEEMTDSEDNPYEDIIMVSSGLAEKPFTIIDGTHRSTYLHKNSRLTGTKGLLGVANNLAGYIWSVERSNMANDLRELNQYAALGMLW